MSLEWTEVSHAGTTALVPAQPLCAAHHRTASTTGFAGTIAVLRFSGRKAKKKKKVGGKEGRAEEELI